MLNSNRELLIFFTFSSFLVLMPLKKPIKHVRESVKLLSIPVFTAFGVAEGNSEKGENEWDVQRGKAASLWQQIS